VSARRLGAVLLGLPSLPVLALGLGALVVFGAVVAIMVRLVLADHRAGRRPPVGQR
jgi:hypothetical protein